MRTASWLIANVLALSALGLAPRASVAEVFHLVGGGTVEGQWLNARQHPAERYEIRTRFGARVVLAAEQVERVEKETARDLAYHEARQQHPDTVEGHWAMAEWCRENHLSEKRTEHLERILELDPEHQPARRALGYRQVDGRWMTRDELMQQRGFVRYKGRWRLPTEVEVLEKRRKEELAVKAWFGRLKRLREELQGDPQQARAAYEAIRAIDDPYAHAALAEQLKEEPDPRLRRLYLDAMANLRTSASIRTLVDVSLRDIDEETRATAVDLLARYPDPAATQAYIVALGDKDNLVVNRAAAGLAALADRSAIRPLIEALVTRHKFQETPGQPGQIAATFGSSSGGGISGSGGGGFSMNNGPKIVTRYLRNPAVLDALIQLTGVNFSYDERQWKNWLASQRRVEEVDARRD